MLLGAAHILSTAVSICGVSAAIATFGAIKGDKKHLNMTLLLIAVFVIPMFLGMPLLAKAMKKSAPGRYGKGSPNSSWIFAFAFVSIGAETSIREFGKIGRAQAIAYTAAQTFNVVWTLIISYILFSAVE